jgi:hypothetical protein
VSFLYSIRRIASFWFGAYIIATERVGDLRLSCGTACIVQHKIFLTGVGKFPLTAIHIFSSLPSAVGEEHMEIGGAKKLSNAEATASTDYLYRRVAERWCERVTNRPFMQMLRTGNLSRDALRLFFRNSASFTIDINTVECATYHKHIAFFRKHRIS